MLQEVQHVLLLLIEEQPEARVLQEEVLLEAQREVQAHQEEQPEVRVLQEVRLEALALQEAQLDLLLHQEVIVVRVLQEVEDHQEVATVQAEALLEVLDLQEAQVLQEVHLLQEAQVLLALLQEAAEALLLEVAAVEVENNNHI